jgi:hypothetical protein
MVGRFSAARGRAAVCDAPGHARGLVMRPTELLASRALAAAIPGAQLVPVLSQAHGEWDFDLIHPDGTTEPVEVTLATDEARERVYAAIAGRRREGLAIPRVLARRDWLITPGERANIKRVRAGADALLAGIEAEGRQRFFAESDWAESAAVRRIYEEMNVEHGATLALRPPGRILLGYPGAGGHVDADHVVDAVRTEVSKRDNRAKLGRSPASRRHLVVLLEGLDPLAKTSMLHGPLPVQLLPLPAEITDVWVVTRMWQEERCRVWRVSSDGRWHDVGEVEIDPVGPPR